MSVDLPEGWGAARLRALVSKLVDGSHNPPAKQPTGRPMLSARNIEGGKILFDDFRYISPEDFEIEHRRTQVQPNDVLLTIVGSIGRVAVVPLDAPPFCLQRSVAVLGAAGIESAFLALQLASPQLQQDLNAAASGTAQKGVYLRTLSELDIHIAPLAEQRRIVAKVEALLSEVNAVRERLAKVPAILKRFRQSVLAAACSGRLTEDVNGGADGGLPSIWELTTVGDVFDIISGEAFKKSEYSDRGVRLLQIANVGFGRTLWEQHNFLPPSYSASHAKLALSDGDVVLALNRPILGDQLKVARIAASDRPAILYQRVARLRAKGKQSEFAFCYFRSPVMRGEVQRRLQGTDQPYLNTSLLPDIPIPFPPQAEQDEIVRRVEALFKVADAIEKHIATATARAEKITQAVLAKAFRGELVPTEAELAREEGREYEPASVLLERIAKERATSGTGGTKKRPKRDAA